MLYFFTGKFRINDMTEDMKKTADEVESLYISWILPQNGSNDDMTTNQFVRMIKMAGFTSSSMIWIVSTDGTIIYCEKLEGENVDFIINEGARETDFPNTRFKMTDPRQYKDVMSLDVKYITQKGDLYGLLSGTGKSWLTVKKPIIPVNRNGQRYLAGAVYVNVPMPEILEIKSPMFKVFIMVVGLSLLVSMILMYIFTKRVTYPLKKIKGAAKVIAKGEFCQPLDIKSNDEIGELAESFNHMAFALQHLEENRREFIANVSHEIRTPITSIRGFVEGILDGTIPEDKREKYLTIIRDEVERINRLVNDLLDLSKIESGEFKLVFKKININELIRRCLIKLEGFIEKKGLDIEANFEHTDVFVLADQDAIERVLINLIHNAIKFTPEGGRIEVGSYTRKDKVIVYIRDNGVGMSEDDVKKIWDRFYKTDKSRSEDKTGMGLGLSIVKSIIHEHKQDIWVDSSPGKGSTFYFTLSAITDE